MTNLFIGMSASGGSFTATKSKELKISTNKRSGNLEEFAVSVHRLLIL